MTVEVVTFGCRLNAAQSEAIRARALEAGLTEAVVVNSCAVTAEAVRQSRQAIRRLRRERPAARIIVTGCAAQIEPKSYAAMDEVDLVLGNGEKLQASSYGDFGTRLRVGNIFDMRAAAPEAGATVGRPRAFLEVQDGCDHRCTFCVIPYGRGNSRSVGMDAVVEGVRRLAESGVAEVVLTGVDLTAYGADLAGKPTLGELVVKILELVPELKRLRLSSIDSIEADPALFRAIAGEERLMPHFHLSTQSGDDLILKRMKRRHSRGDTIGFCETVRRLRPDAAFGADLIAGFPTESEAMFENSLSLIDDAGLSNLHVFGFSPRAGTPAARMPQLDRALVKERSRRLRIKGEAATAARLARMVGSERLVLVEGGGLGRTECYASARLTGPMPVGAILPMRITGADAGHLVAEAMP